MGGSSVCVYRPPIVAGVRGRSQHQHAPCVAAPGLRFWTPSRCEPGSFRQAGRRRARSFMHNPFWWARRAALVATFLVPVALTAAEPARNAGVLPVGDDGRPLNLDFET